MVFGVHCFNMIDIIDSLLHHWWNTELVLSCLIYTAMIHFNNNGGLLHRAFAHRPIGHRFKSSNCPFVSLCKTLSSLLSGLKSSTNMYHSLYIKICVLLTLQLLLLLFTFIYLVLYCGYSKHFAIQIRQNDKIDKK